MRQRRPGLLLAGSLGLAAALSLALPACEHSSLPIPKTAPHTGDEPVVVPYPPPPAHVEIVPPQPTSKGMVWVDGEWQWRAGKWVWKGGDWETPAPGACYAPPDTVRLTEGVLKHFAGAWHPPQDCP
jgi:hypothetical protein